MRAQSLPRPSSMQRLLIGSALFLFTSCRAEDRTASGDSAGAEPQPAPATLARTADSGAAPTPSDHAVYTAVLREHFMQPERGEHALLCDREQPGRGLAFVATTQPLPRGTPARDSAWTAELPAPAAPLMAALRALDRQPGRILDADSLGAGVPIRLVPDSLAARSFRRTDSRAARPDSSAPSLFWFSRVVYTADSRWALVQAVQVCPGATEVMAANAENGAYERVLIAVMEWRAGAWIAHPALFLDVSLPRLEPR